MRVTILGSASAKPTAGRHPAAQVVNIHEQLYLVDAGEGVQRQLFRYGINPLKLRGVFISHLHGDHMYGLFPLISTLGLFGKKTPLKIFAPAPFGEILEYHLRYFGEPPYAVEWIHVDTTKHQIVFESKTVEVWSVPLRHRIPTSGYLFRDKKSGRSYAYLSDTSWAPPAAAYAQGVDLMYHEATYADELRRTARKRGHSTAIEAARMAAAAGARKLLIGHYSSRYKDEEVLVNEARAVFENTLPATEGTTFDVP